MSVVCVPGGGGAARPCAGVRVTRGREGLSTRRAVKERRRDQWRSLITVYTSPIICVNCAIKTFPTVHSLIRGTKGRLSLEMIIKRERKLQRKAVMTNVAGGCVTIGVW